MEVDDLYANLALGDDEQAEDLKVRACNALLDLH